ncbi:hypothetical protein [Gimesia chilikensis]|jgi:hypothetical protein|uniref:hypothetical protein n=1 Tax=Gimesia chilikensis TaxID=2605989 RepID=UPI00118B653A|nr:hypothetical protein [Gimesia chilikensis]MCR9232859.1 hypothetical protein [bacterium]QDT82492.1 hypothetical protein MalM14_01190 [Gimesia chilikensis]
MNTSVTQPAAEIAASNRKTLVIPLLIIAIGTGWLLTTLNIVPGLNWIWILGLAITGLTSFAVSGIDKSSVLIGPFFLIASTLSVLRQIGYVTFNIEIPILVIVIGCLLLIARSPSIPLPKWMVFDSTGHSGE